MANRAADLIGYIRESYEIVREYEGERLLTTDVIAKRRCRKRIDEQNERIADWGRALTALAVPIPRDVVEILAGAGMVPALPKGLTPLPPDPYFAHRYPLQKHFTGRLAERKMLTQWFTADPYRPVLALMALGGMGKSALTWAWALRDLLGWPLPGGPDEDGDPDCRVPEADRPAGLLWWSFYEPGSHLAAFLEKAVPYVSSGQLSAAALPSIHDRVEALLTLLQHHNVLLVLDGFERALRAYAGLGAAYQDDAADPPECEDPRVCTDPHAGDLLRALASFPLPLRGRVLLTTRLVPRALDGLAGARVVKLESLAPDDAVAFFHRLEVRGTAAEIQEACAPYGYHPLALRLLAGLVVSDPAQPGDIAVARRYRVVDELVPRAHHILQVAYDALRPAERELLSRIAAFRGPVAYEALEALSPEGAEELPAALRALVERGLLFQDRDAARYDLHPVVRRYAYDRLEDKAGVHTRLRDYFAAAPEPAKVETLADLAATIELYHHTVRAGRYDEARALYQGRLHEPLYYRLGAYATAIELLTALFPDREGQPPRLEKESDQAWTLNKLANAYARSGRPHRASELRERAIALVERAGDKPNQAVYRQNLATDQLSLGRLAAAAANLRRTIALCQELADQFWEGDGHRVLGLVLAYAGMYTEAAEELHRAIILHRQRKQPQAEGLAWASLAIGALLRGDAAAAGLAAARAEALAEETARRKHSVERDLIRALWLRGAALVAGVVGSMESAGERAGEGETKKARGKGQGARGKGISGPGGQEHAAALAEAAGLLDEALARCRKINLVEFEPAILLDIARGHRARGEGATAARRAQEALDIADRCEYRLHQAEAHNLLARLELDAGEEEKAWEHAATAREQARCDGSPYAYQAALEEAEAILNAMRKTFTKRLDELQPSQLFISAAKLAQVRRDFDPQRPESLAPIPIKALEGRVVMTDGHTRALAAFLAGLAEVPVVWDEDELDWEAYQICVDWCLAAGIRTVADLQDRIVPADEYEVVWHQRCREMQRDLASARLLDTDEHR